MFFFIIMVRSMARPTAGIMPPAVEKPERTQGTWFCRKDMMSSITKEPMPVAMKTGTARVRKKQKAPVQKNLFTALNLPDSMALSAPWTSETLVVMTRMFSC